MTRPEQHRTPLTRAAYALVTLLLTACTFADEAAEAPKGSADRGAPKRRALLVGCTYYPNLAEDRWLNGPENDVALMRELLEGEAFGFDPKDVVGLAGWPKDERRRPTRANILRELDKLADDAGADDTVVILLAGHGSQQPADDDPADQELDGLDEIFLPADVGEWNGERGRVENAIVDDEIRSRVAAVAAKGARVWLIVDACHSGTMVRGAPPEVQRERRLPPEALVPESALTAARKRARTKTQRGTPPSMLLDRFTAGNVVATYAAQPDETTKERPLPAGAARFHGQFTYVLAGVLGESRTPMTYRELTDRIVGRYRSLGWPYPTPVVEGGGIDGEVLGLRQWPGRSRLLIQGRAPDAGGRFELNAGYLHGLRRDSILAVRPPAGSKNPERLLGHVRIAEVRAIESVVVPVEYEGRKAPDPDGLEPGSRCRVVFVDYGEMRLRVALQTGSESGELTTHPPGNGPPALEHAFSKLGAERQKLFERVTDPLEADWFVRSHSGEVLLVPAAGWSSSAPAPSGETAVAGVPPRFRLESVDDKREMADRLLERLRTIARARHLLSLAGTDGVARADETGLEVTLDLLRWRGKASQTVELEEGGRVLRPGDLVSFKVANSGDHPVDVTLLFVDSGYGIRSVFPSQERREYNRIEPGKEEVTEPWTVTADTVGAEQIVAIAVKAAADRPVDFSYLEQETLKQAATRGAGARAKSPLARLLEHATYGEGRVRGLARADVDAYVTRILAWRVVPDDAPDPAAGGGQP